MKRSARGEAAGSLLGAQGDVEAQHHLLVLLEAAEVDLEVLHGFHHVLLPVLDKSLSPAQFREMVGG